MYNDLHLLAVWEVSHDLLCAFLLDLPVIDASDIVSAFPCFAHVF